MHHLAAISASLASLGLVCAIYYCNIISRPGSWLRGEMVTMILVSLLTGLFPLAVGFGVIGLVTGFTDGFGVTAMLAAGVDLASFGIVVATVLVFRALVKATSRAVQGPGTITPLSPRPASPRTFVPATRDAA